jgi:hypothetical protein
LQSCHGENQASLQNRYPMCISILPKSNNRAISSSRRIVLLQDLPGRRTRSPVSALLSFYQDISARRSVEPGTIMRLHLISGAVLLYTLLTLAAICMAELGAMSQNVPF